MKLTRFAQSCLLIETKGKRILVDPGNIFFEESLLAEYWNNIDFLFVTHKHSDHCHVPAILEIMKNPQTKFYSTSEVAEKHTDLSPDIIKV
jgi:L-ascorbate metabolism protein UlaG (beta-lactamase superfamily)